MEANFEKQKPTELTPADPLLKAIQRCVASLGSVIKPPQLERLMNSVGLKSTYLCLTFAIGLDKRDSFLSSLQELSPKINADRLSSYLDVAYRMQTQGRDWYDLWSLCSQLEQFRFSAQEFDAVLNSIYELLNADAKHYISFRSLTRLCTLGSDQFRAALTATQRIFAAGQNPSNFIDNVASEPMRSLTPGQFLAVLDCMASIAALGRPVSWAATELPRLAQDLDSRRLLIILDGILQERDGFETLINIDRAGVSGVIGAIGQLANQAEDFREKLYAVLQFCAKNRSSGIQGKELAIVLKAGIDLSTCLSIAELLLQRLAAISGWRAAVSNFAELFGRVWSIKKHYSDYELRYHAAVTTEETETSYDSYYGDSTHTYTREHYHSWIELLPCGEHISAIAGSLIDTMTLQKLFAERSWMYAASDEAGRSQALERCALVRSSIPQMLDSLMRQGLLESEAAVASIHLIGSYPWSARPNDIDIFIIVEGDRRVTHYPSAVLAERGFHCPELPLPVDIEIVGSKTLWRATPGDQAKHDIRLALRRPLLFASVLLAGRDQFAEDGVPSTAEWRALEDDLKIDLKKESWPELGKDKSRIAAKKAWRIREIRMLAEFISKRTKGST